MRIIPRWKVGNLGLREVKSVIELGCEPGQHRLPAPPYAVAPLLTVSLQGPILHIE